MSILECNKQKASPKYQHPSTDRIMLNGITIRPSNRSARARDITSMLVASTKPRRAGVRPGQVCWGCGELGHFQDQYPQVEVGALVQNPNSPHISPYRAGMDSIPA
ncbi:hypothetical protein SRHO_G00075910 [Serrasalmus rhombeus]